MTGTLENVVLETEKEASFQLFLLVTHHCMLENRMNKLSFNIHRRLDAKLLEM